jgi:subfamily B ATP-binding cassette protein MsbA
MIAMVPSSLIMAVLIGFALKQLLSTPAFLPWENLLGAVASVWIHPLVQGSSIERGLPLEVQARVLPVALLLAAALAAFFRFAQDYLLEDIGERIARDVRNGVSRAFLGMDYRAASRVKAGLLPAMMGDDSREIRLAFTSIAGQIPSGIVQSVVFLTWLLVLDIQLFLLFAAVLLPAGLVIRVTGKLLKRFSRQGLDLQADLFGALLEKLRGWQTIRVFDAIPFELARFDEFNKKLFTAWRRATRAKALGSPLVEWLAAIAAAMAIVVALRRIAEQEMTSEMFAVFLATVALLANSLQMLTIMINGSRKGQEAFRRAAEFLEFADESRRPDGLIAEVSFEKPERLEIVNLSVANSETGVLLARGISTNIASGDTCVVIGASGTGKSTLFRVLLGLEAAAEGEVRWNGRLLSENGHAQMSRHVAFLPQDPFLFDGTVLENLVYPKLEAELSAEDLRRVPEALERANLQKMPTDTVKSLSGGERQRLAFARVFFANPAIILIDEGTSALDLANERALLESLRSDAQNRISIIIAHRPMVREFASHVVDLSPSAG